MDYVYENPLQLTGDDTEYRLLSKDHIKIVEVEVKTVLKVAPEALQLLASEALADVSFLLFQHD